MLKISGPTVPAAVVAVVLVAAIDGSAPVRAANDCIAGPTAPSPQGQHWYYRIDRPTGRKCWYLRSFLSHPHRGATTPSESDLAAAQPTSAAPPPVPAPRPAAGPATPASQHEIKILNVSTVQYADPPRVQAPQQNAQQPTAAPSILQASAAGETKDPSNTAARPAIAVVRAADGAEAPNAASPAPSADDAAKPQALATIGPTEMFFLVVLGIGLATFMLAVVIKIVGGQRARPVHEDPDSAWRRYRLDYQDPDREAANARASHARTASKKSGLALAGPYTSGRKELEPALRALGRGRRHVAA